MRPRNLLQLFVRFPSILGNRFAPRAQASLRQPSFRYKLAESKRLDKSLGYTDPVWAINGKLEGYRFAEALGLTHPKVLGEYASIHDLDWDQLPQAFVIKPRQGCSSDGISPLVRKGHDKFEMLLEGGMVTKAKIVAHIDGLAARGAISPELLVEELLTRQADEGKVRLPFDWKFYCFHGSAKLILQRDPRGGRLEGGARFKFYSPDWRDLGRIRRAKHVDASLPAPHHPGELLEVAELVSRNIERPFIRVDLFDTHERVVFDEITPHPGGDQDYIEPIDRLLGQAWEEAEIRLLVKRGASAAPGREAIGPAGPARTPTA